MYVFFPPNGEAVEIPIAVEDEVKNLAVLNEMFKSEQIQGFLIPLNQNQKESEQG